MTLAGSEVYDPFHVHVHHVEAQLVDEGAAIRCTTCRAELQIVCPNGHPDPMEPIRKSKGPVARAPKTEERKKKQPKAKPVYVERYCQLCESRLSRGARHPICASCRNPLKPKFVAPQGQRLCTGPCAQVKPFSDFYFNKGTAYSNCKVCWNRYIADRNAAKRARG